jgi:hypothetical protein
MQGLKLIPPPVGLHGSTTVAAIVLIGTIIPLVAAVAWAISRRRYLLIAMLVGGFLAGFVESQLDTLSRIWWASNLPRAYTTFGRPIPLLVPFTYSLVIGGGAYLAYVLCLRGKRRDVIRFGIAFSVLEPVFEMLLMTTHFYRYYGPQPIDVFGYPLYWGPINGVGATSAGVLLYVWRNNFAGRRTVLAAVIVPLSFGMDFAVGWPLFAVMSTHASKWAISLVSLVPIALCAAELWIVSSYVGNHDPATSSDPQVSSRPDRTEPVIRPEAVPTVGGV